MIKAIAILALAIASTNAFWSPCSQGPPPTSVTSPSCSGSSCTVTRGEGLAAVVVFSPAQSTPHLDVIIKAYFFGIELDIPNSPGNENGEEFKNDKQKVLMRILKFSELNFEILIFFGHLQLVFL
jgi:hypothetical protein